MLIRRREFFNQRNVSLPGSQSIGVFDAGHYSRFVGFFSVIGSATIRYRFGTDSANFFTSSSFIVNSGATTFDILNLARFTEWTITQATSQSMAGALIIAETLR